MDNNRATVFRSLGEAHLYVAVAKADGLLSQKERARAPYYAKKSQKVFDILKINQNVRRRIKKDVTKILSEPEYSEWSAEQHLDKAITFLKKAKQAGDWGVRLTFHKNRDGLLQVAFLDGYILKESKFIKEIERRLAEIANKPDV